MYCKSLVDVVNSGLCISCGTCVSINSDEHHMVEQKGILLPQNPSKMKFQDIGYSLCPGKGYEIIKMGAELFKLNSSFLTIDVPICLTKQAVPFKTPCEHFLVNI